MDSARQTAREYLNQHHLSTDELWLHYWSNGGATLNANFSVYMTQAQAPPEGEQQVLTWALRDLVAEDADWYTGPPTGARVSEPGPPA